MRKQKMTPDAVSRWIDAMKEKGKAATDADCAHALGIGPNTLIYCKEKGGNLRMALACAALLYDIEPYE